MKEDKSFNPTRRGFGTVSASVLFSLGAATVAGCADTSSARQTAGPAPTGPVSLGIHHLKFTVSDMEKSLAFYEAAFSTRRITALDHRKPDGSLFGVILEFPGIGTQLELRLDPKSAQAQKGVDPMTLTVEGPADLENWSAHFDRKGLPHSPVLVGLVGWLVVVEDPDGRRLRLYTKQTHGPELKPSWDSPWIN